MEATMLQDWLNNLPYPPMAMIGVTMIAIAAIVLALYPFAHQKETTVRNRALQLRDYRESIEQGVSAPVARTVEEDTETRSFGSRVIWALRKLSQATGYLMLFDPNEQKKLKRQLLLAGIRNPDALILMFTGKMIGIFVMVVLIILAWFFVALPVPAPIFWLCSIGFIILGGVIPEKIVGALASKRQKAILLTLPDALDLMIVCTNAGFSLDVTVGRVSRDIRSFAPEMADELHILSDELKVLQDRREAMENLANRTEVSGVRSLVTALIQAGKLGTPINQALKTVAEEIRREHIINLEEWAAKVPTKMTFPIVLLILPAIFLIVGGPAFLNVMRVL